MERKELRDRLHLSGIDGQAAALAGKWGLGFEIAEFCWAPRLEQPDAMELVRQQIAGVERLWLHAPFAELAPCAIDPLVREAALRRFRQTIRTARMLGVKRIVVHGGYIPLVYFPEWYMEQSAVFWKELLADVPPDMVLAVENVMEPGPDMLVQIAEQVNDPRLGLCLDVGHANTSVSRTPPMESPTSLSTVRRRALSTWRWIKTAACPPPSTPTASSHPKTSTATASSSCPAPRPTALPSRPTASWPG